MPATAAAVALLIFYAALAQGYERSEYVDAEAETFGDANSGLSFFSDLSGQSGPLIIGERVPPAAPAEVPPAPEPPQQPTVDVGTVELAPEPGSAVPDIEVNAPVFSSERYVSLTFYNCYGMGGGYCGGMSSGAGVYEGAAACGYSMALGTRFTIEGDATGRVYTCEDRGLGPYDWVDIFFWSYAEGRAWRNNLPASVTLHLDS